jgi:DNA-binding beta-propeller fold protein YncE
MGFVQYWRSWAAAAGTAAMVLAAGAIPASAATSGPTRSAVSGGQSWASTNTLNAEGGFARSVATSPDGQMVVVTGVADAPGSVANYDTVAYNAATGAQLWAAQYSGAGGLNYATSVAVSPDSSTVFVTGSSTRMSSSVNNFATVAYDASTGARLWVRQWAGPGTATATAEAIAVAGPHTVIVTGTSPSVTSAPIVVTVAYNDATGATQWVRKYSNSEGETLAVSPDGNTAYVTGTNGNDYNTIAYAVSGGARKWVARYQARTISGNPDNTLTARSIAVSPGGRSVYVTGTAGNAHRGTNHDYATIAYNATTGMQVWARRYNGPGNSNDQAHSVAVGPNGKTVYVTGASPSVGGRDDYATIAYSAAKGKQLWVARYKTPSDNGSSAWVVRVGDGGHTVYVTGTYLDEAETAYDAATIAYSATTGAERWTSTYDGLYMDSPQNMTLSPDQGTVYVVGSGSGPGGAGSSYVTVAYQA